MDRSYDKKTACGQLSEITKNAFAHPVRELKGVMTRLIVDALSELCSPFLKGGDSAFIAAIASGFFPQTEHRSLE